MIDVTAAPGTFTDKKSLAQALAEAMMRWEGSRRFPCSWGGWGIGGHAFTNAEIAETARRDLAGT
jgi:hypothetical protein